MDNRLFFRLPYPLVDTVLLEEKINKVVCKEKLDSYFHEQLIFLVNKKRSSMIYRFECLWPLEDNTSNKTQLPICQSSILQVAG